MTSKRPASKASRVPNGLVALSSAAVLTVYAAGYLRTRAAADRVSAATERRMAAPMAIIAAAPNPAGLPPADALAQTFATPGTATTSAPQIRKSAADVSPRRTTAELAAAPSGVAESLPASVLPQSVAPQPAAAPAAVPAAVVPPAAVEPVATATPVPHPQYKDGTYLGWGTSRHGDIQASVVIEGGRIASATIAQCLTRYSCSWIASLPPQVVSRQSPEVDYVSGATQSTNAFYYAVVEALSKAR